MEVKILSKEMIKPSSSTISLLEPYKLCLFDQLTPSTYVPLILFYLNFPHNSTIHIHLKNSLSQALNLFYPFSGRIRNNSSVDRFDTGVLFSRAQISSSIAEFLKRFNRGEEEEEVLNQFLPFCSFNRELAHYSPFLGFQMNQFSCGGIAIGINFSHKLCDGMTLSLLLKTWAAIACGLFNEIHKFKPNLYELSTLFPPRQSLPQNYVDVMEHFWFKETCNKNKNITRRFLFTHNAIASLRIKAKSKISLETPSRIQTLTGFIWKHAMKALEEKKNSVLTQVMNIRPRLKLLNVSSEAMGNPILWATAVSTAEAVELDEIITMMDRAVAWFNRVDVINGGEEGKLETVLKEYFKKLEDQVICDNEKSEVFVFSSWIGLFEGIDFGWGVPFWITPMGKAGSEFTNMIVFTEMKESGGIEAWITLDEKIMAILECDIEFLAFTSKFNNVISKL